MVGDGDETPDALHPEPIHGSLNVARALELVVELVVVLVVVVVLKFAGDLCRRSWVWGAGGRFVAPGREGTRSKARRFGAGWTKTAG